MSIDTKSPHESSKLVYFTRIEISLLRDNLTHSRLKISSIVVGTYKIVCQNLIYIRSIESRTIFHNEVLQSVCKNLFIVMRVRHTNSLSILSKILIEILTSILDRSNIIDYMTDFMNGKSNKLLTSKAHNGIKEMRIILQTISRDTNALSAHQIVIDLLSIDRGIDHNTEKHLIGIIRIENLQTGRVFEEPIEFPLDSRQIRGIEFSSSNSIIKSILKFGKIIRDMSHYVIPP